MLWLGILQFKTPCMADPYSNMVAGANDGLQTALVKACHWAKNAAETMGGSDAAGMFPIMAPQASDTLQVVAIKLAYWTQQIADNA